MSKKVTNLFVTAPPVICVGADFIETHSLTNTGCTCRVLKLTPTKWDWERGNIVCCLPTTPTGGVGRSRLKRKAK